MAFGDMLVLLLGAGGFVALAAGLILMLRSPAKASVRRVELLCRAAPACRLLHVATAWCARRRVPCCTCVVICMC